LQELGPGAAYALWGFRAAAIQHTNCPALIGIFESAFGEFGRPALGSLNWLARELGAGGGRKIKIACPQCNYATADELSLVALLAAAQSGDNDLCSAHLFWLMCGKGEDGALNAALGVCAVFSAVGLAIIAPQIELARTSRRPLNVFHNEGHA
jgi:hypothetical protein